jgi:hypothetical protein
LRRLQHLGEFGNLISAAIAQVTVMPKPTRRERFESALAETNPDRALSALAQSLKAEGTSQLEMYHLFNEFRAKLQDDDSPKLDAILDTMDCIVGWGNPACWIFDQQLDRSLYDPAFMKRKDQA